MKRILVAGCVAIAAMAAFAGTNQVASAAQGKEDARAEAKREREAQRKALEMIQGELKRQREEHATKVGREAHVDERPAQPVVEDVFARQIKFAKAQDIMRALSILVMESTKGAEMALNQGSLEKNAMIKRNEAMYLSGMPGGNEGAIRGKVLLLADDRTNKLIVITRKANMDIFDSVIAELDVEVAPANGNSP